MNMKLSKPGLRANLVGKLFIEKLFSRPLVNNIYYLDPKRLKSELKIKYKNSKKLIIFKLFF